MGRPDSTRKISTVGTDGRLDADRRGPVGAASHTQAEERAVVEIPNKEIPSQILIAGDQIAVQTAEGEETALSTHRVWTSGSHGGSGPFRQTWITRRNELSGFALEIAQKNVAGQVHVVGRQMLP